MDNSLNLVAFDCGNSSIRTILCRFDGKKVVSELILQEPNEMTVSGGYYYWDMPDDILAARPSFSGKIGYICEYDG